MIQRCANPNDSSAYLYGARGISVCLEWRESFETFEAWALSHDYAPDLTIDRKDPDGNYEPENCRWITNAEQQGNRRNNHRVTAFGKTQTIAEWMRDSGIASATIIRRLKLGWLPETAVSKEVRKCQKKKH
jgi:hypothetical protein